MKEELPRNRVETKDILKFEYAKMAMVRFISEKCDKYSIIKDDRYSCEVTFEDDTFNKIHLFSNIDNETKEEGISLYLSINGKELGKDGDIDIVMHDVSFSHMVY